MFYDSNHVEIPITHPGAATDAQPRGPAARRARLSVPMAAARTLARGSRRQLLAGALSVAILGLGPARAQGSVPSLERKVKAAFLYKFLGYTEFPASAFGDGTAPVVIGVVGADELAAELGRVVAGRTVQARPVAVKVFKEGEIPSGVHLLFVGGSDSARLRSVLKSAQPGPVLLVSEAENGLQQGSVINFKIVEERVRFDVSLEAADKNSIKLSSRLLTVANHVHKGAP